MTKLIELRERLLEFYGKYNKMILFAIKFILAFFAFAMINNRVGYMSSLNHLYVVLALAVLCAPFSINVTLITAAAMITIHLYALSAEVAGIALLFFLVLFFLYFRFSPKNGYYVLITPLAFVCNIPYAVPLAAGLLRSPFSMISIIFGTMIYYLINGLKNNAVLLEEVSLQEQTANKAVIAINQLVGNKEMYLMLAALLMALLVIYFIRRQYIDHAWKIAIFTGLLTEFAIVSVGYILMGITGRMIWVIIGTLLSGVLGVVIEFFCFNLDYSRTEKVQFEDDEYYYYVKAIPKVNLSSGEKQIKKISKKL